MTAISRPTSDVERQVLLGRHHDPFEVLGCHRRGQLWQVQAMVPGAAEMQVLCGDSAVAMARLNDTDLFSVSLPRDPMPDYRLRATDSSGRHVDFRDPYCFIPVLGDLDLHLFGEGRHEHLYRILGAHLCEHQGVPGIRFATWAPNAERVSVVGDFNGWHGLAHPMRVRGQSGVWELFIPEILTPCHYKFEILDRSGGLHLKTDPFGNRFELRPANASIADTPSTYQWGDARWLRQRAERNWQHNPLSIYEVHLGSWQLGDDNEMLNYRELAHRLAIHIEKLGFTHIELLPITEYPFEDSWGYQATGYFAPTSRFGTPDDFRYFVDYLHQRGIGIILDWVPAHFPRDAHGLARFDGTALYEHENPLRGEHRDWGTLIFNFGRPEVSNFLLASANYWIEEFHLDGLRVDAVASMLYLDYSRPDGEWEPNAFGGNENLEAIEFLRELNTRLLGRHPGVLTIAEESTAWPQVTRPSWVGGLGFCMKWNMGWMHDTLNYMALEPVFRHYHHDQLTFGLMYAFSENYVLPFSHDEVVHEKRSLLGRMPGDDWQRFANLRLLYTYMFTYPGAKLLFMGAELAEPGEWSHLGQLSWALLEQPAHAGVQHLVGDLNRLYRNTPSLFRQAFTAAGFEWIDCSDATQSVVAYLRRDGDDFVVVVLNFTPVVRHDYRVGVPREGIYREIHNSDAHYYGGSNVSNGRSIASDAESWMGRPFSLSLTLPPLAGIVLQRGDADA